jgi:hypothetical protein
MSEKTENIELVIFPHFPQIVVLYVMKSTEVSFVYN